MASRSPRATLLLGTLLAIVAAGCSSGGADRGPSGGRGGRMSQAVPVAAVEVRPRDLARTVTVTGPIEPIRTVSVNALTSGTVLRVLVEEGSRVAPGELMAELDARETAAQLERARATLANAESSFQRAQRLRERDLNSAAELDDARSAFEIAQADVELWNTRLAFTRITAPVRGVVTAKRVERGDAVSANQSVFEIADDSQLAVRVQVSELDVVQLQPGRQVTLRLDAYPNVRLEGRIRRIFPSADPASRLVPVEVVLGRVPAGVQAKPGFLARVELSLDHREGVLAVPAAAIGASDAGAFVYVVDADTLIRRPVETGLTASGWIEVTHGLEAGERVVSSGQMNLRPGAPVEVSEGLPAPGATQ
jgi:membrane fusion protein (multidrug efflux system)